MTALLAFDTATEHLFVGLRAGGREWLHESEGGARASARLLPVAMGLLAEAGLSANKLDAIAFGRGPGAFTGLRTAASAAQGLALGAGRPVIAVDSLMAVAEDARRGEAPTTTWVAMDARMNEVYAAPYRFDGAAWQALAAPTLYDPAELEARWIEQACDGVAGNALTVFPGLAATVMHQSPAALPRARALLALAEAAWHRGEAMDAAQALPTYVRDKVAQTTAERDAARRMKEGLVMHGDAGVTP